MVREAIILAGGLGTRLQSEIPDLPKCMAPVAGRPFLYHLLRHLRAEGIERFIFSLGFRHEVVEEWLKEEFATLDYITVVEKKALGTGGAVKFAADQAKDRHVLIANGDTLFRVGLEPFFNWHEKNRAGCSVALKPMRNFERYGAVEMNERGRITAFREKVFTESGFINGGIYLLDLELFRSLTLPEAFSLEKEFLEPLNHAIFGYAQDAYFIDIGVPKDFRKAGQELAMPTLDLERVDKDWTLFIDRDGVINPEKKDDYIRSLEEFRFYEGVPEALAKCRKKFGRLIVVSNQRGVGRRLMTEESLNSIHEHMQSELAKKNAAVDAIYYAISADVKNPLRKPNPGMAFLAKKEFPGIELQKSIMIGNKVGDMRFGRHAGMYTVFVATTNPETAFPHPDIDLRFPSLPDFANSL